MMLAAPVRVVLAAAIGAGVLMSAGASLAQTTLYGGIEIGGKGVKAVGVPIDAEGTPDLPNLVKNLKRKAVNNVTLADRLPNGDFRKEAIDDARAAIAEFYDQLTGLHKIPPERIWIVASSGLTIKGKPGNFDALAEAVSQATGKAVALTVIDQKKEVELLIRGAIPRDFVAESVLLDIGSGNSKIGYYQPKNGINVARPNVLAAEIEGTVTFRNAILKERDTRKLEDFAGFATVATELRKGVAQKVKADLGRYPGLVNRPRIFLGGGVVWAITSLSRPAALLDDPPYVEISLEDIRAFNKALRADGQVPMPALDKLAPEQQKPAQEKVQAVLETFTPEDLLAGSELLLGFAEALNWEGQKKKLYFANAAVVGWIVGFVDSAKK